MQSNDYVPGVSGWKLNMLTGEFEINSAKISVGDLSEQSQMITVTAGEWAAQDLPENAIEHYAFIGSEISKIPVEYRASAEIGTFDDSYEPGFVHIRTKLTYQRPETAEEMAARINASRSSGYSIKKEGDKLTFFHNGVPRIVLGNLDKAEEKIATPFAVDGDQVFLHKNFIDAAAFESSWVVRTTTNAAGQTVLTGIGGLVGCCGESLTAKIEHEVTTRATADNQLAARIGALEARISAAGSSITQQGAAITPLK